MNEEEMKHNRKRLIGRILSTVIIAIGLIVLLYPTFTDLYTNLLQRKNTQTTAAAFAAQKKIPDGAVTILEIPRIKYQGVVYEGVTTQDLKRGPGHYPKTAVPGQIGNCVIAGHRIPAVFKDLDRIQYDDPIFLYGKDGKYLYRVMAIRFVKPTDMQVVLPTGVNMVTLITCHPYLKPTGRLVIQAALTRIIPYGNPRTP